MIHLSVRAHMRSCELHPARSIHKHALDNGWGRQNPQRDVSRQEAGTRERLVNRGSEAATRLPTMAPPWGAINHSRTSQRNSPCGALMLRNQVRPRRSKDIRHGVLGTMTPLVLTVAPTNPSDIWASAPSEGAVRTHTHTQLRLQRYPAGAGKMASPRGQLPASYLPQ